MAGKDNGLPTSIVIFGASGDLTKRKLIPSLFNLYCKERMPKMFRIVGYGSTEFTDESFREHLKELPHRRRDLQAFRQLANNILLGACRHRRMRQRISQLSVARDELGELRKAALDLYRIGFVNCDVQQRARVLGGRLSRTHGNTCDIQ